MKIAPNTVVAMNYELRLGDDDEVIDATVGRADRPQPHIWIGHRVQGRLQAVDHDAVVSVLVDVRLDVVPAGNTSGDLTVFVHLRAYGDGHPPVGVVRLAESDVTDVRDTVQNAALHAVYALRVVGEITVWQGHDPETLRAMRENVANAAAAGIEADD